MKIKKKKDIYLDKNGNRISVGDVVVYESLLGYHIGIVSDLWDMANGLEKQAGIVKPACMLFGNRLIFDTDKVEAINKESGSKFILKDKSKEESEDHEYDQVKRPFHYDGDGVTTCKVAMKSMLSSKEGWFKIPKDVVYWWSCAFKYLWRWPFKGQNKEEILKDIDKCSECILEMRKEVERCR